MQDIFGQLPRMKGYTHLALCFPHPEGLKQEATVAFLEAATRRITSALPWIGGSVINQGAGTGCSGLFTVVPCTRTEAVFRIQDRSDVCPSYEEILQAREASDLLDVAILSAESSLPDSYTDSSCNPAPVLTLTASWIKGGIVLDCAAQHNILDMGGIDQLLKLLATALQGQAFDQYAIDINTRDRLSLFPLLAADEANIDHSQMQCPSSLDKPLRPPPPPGPIASFHHFRFKATSLSQLQSLAETPSLDDALSAFVWKRLSAVRMSQAHTPDAVTGFSRALDCRRTLGIPVEYMGVVAVKAYSTMRFDELGSSSLAIVAARLRKDVRTIRDRTFLRSLATLIAEEPDKSTINFVKGFNPDTWVNASSWAGVGAYGLDFGPLGKPAIIRRPKSKPVQGLLYFLPRLEQGDMDVLLCLKENEIQGLRSDPEWSRYGEYIG